MNERSLWEKYGKKQMGKITPLGPHSSYHLQETPRRLLFSLSRYKFAAKMIGDKKEVLELGCSDGLGTRLLAEFAAKVTAVDFDKKTIRFAQETVVKKNVAFVCDNFLNGSFGNFDAVVAFDVIEHILKKNERLFFETICRNLRPNGVCLIGTPSLVSRKYSSKIVNDAHVNLYSHARLEASARKYFHHAFMFSGNDELIHTGFKPMAHYLIVLACGKRR